MIEMLKVTVATAVVLVALGACSLVYAGGGQQVAAPAPKAKKDAVDEKAIRALIAELGDESFAKREAAHKRLAAIGAAALPLLEKAAKESADAEVRERVEQLIRRLNEHQSAAALPPEGIVFDIAFSKDGQTLAAACVDNVIRIYDWKTRQLRQTLRGHHARVWTVAFSPDGKKLASCTKESDPRPSAPCSRVCGLPEWGLPGYRRRSAAGKRRSQAVRLGHRQRTRHVCRAQRMG